jgi:hypothetical protein
VALSSVFPGLATSESRDFSSSDIKTSLN